MNAALGLQRLLVWLSPAFPVGSFAYSAGLETAIANGAVSDRKSTENWIQGALRHGGLRQDAILVAESFRAHADAITLAELADLCLALVPSAERHNEVLLTGDAFLQAARAWPTPHPLALPQPCPYPVAIGAIAGAHALPRDAVLLAFLTAAVQTQISVAVRLVPIGQTAGLAIAAALEQEIAAAAERAGNQTLADLGAIGYAADIAQMRHETLPTRIFRS